MTDDLNAFLKGIQRRQAITIKRLDSIEKALEEYPADENVPEVKPEGLFSWFLALVGWKKRGGLDDAA